MARLSLVTLLFAAAAAGATSFNDCFSEYGTRIAESSECGDENVLRDCLAEIEGYDKEYLADCYKEAGCSPKQANRETLLAIRLCKELSNNELRRRQNSDSATDAASDTAAASSEAASSSAQASSSAKASSTAAASTTAEASSSSSAAASSSTAASSASAASTSTTLVSSTTFTSTTASSTVTTSASSQTGDVRSGTACFSTSDKSTKLCDVSTSGGREHTESCSSTTVKQSACYDNMLCTTNASGGDICMILHGIESGGIAIATILGVASAALVVGVFAASMLESKRQKRAAAKAAAIAITRSATMKKQQLADPAPAS